MAASRFRLPTWRAAATPGAPSRMPLSRFGVDPAGVEPVCGRPPAPVRYAAGALPPGVVRRDGFEPPAATWATALQAAALTTLPPTLGVITRYRAGTYRVTTWHADLYTMTTVPSEGIGPPHALCRSAALPLRQPGLLLLSWHPWQESNPQRQVRSLA